jgi:MFS family permease
MIGGLMIGSVVAAKFAQKIGTKFAVALGFSIMAIGLLLGTGTTLSTTDAYLILWTGVIGLGLGVAMPTVATAAMSVLSADRSASGTALISAVRQVGGTLGIALLGTTLGASYRDHLQLANVPGWAAGPIRDSVIAGVTIAHKIGSSALLLDVRSAFVNGLGAMLWICGGIAIVAVVLALLFLPNLHGRKAATK